MVKMCRYAERRICDLWIDYQVTKVALQDVEELCSGNWKEIVALRDRIDLLESILTEAGIEYPESYI